MHPFAVRDRSGCSICICFKPAVHGKWHTRGDACKETILDFDQIVVFEQGLVAALAPL